MLLRRAAHNLAESRHLKAVDPSGAQTCPALFPDNLLRSKERRCREDPPARRSKTGQKRQEWQGPQNTLKSLKKLVVLRGNQ